RFTLSASCRAHAPPPRRGRTFLVLPPMNRLPPALRSLAIYVLLVAVPLVALAAILHAGKRLRAPAAVAGEWRVDVAGLPLDSAAAAAFRTLSIAQSGPHLSITLAGREMRGSLSGDSVAAARRAEWG